MIGALVLLIVLIVLAPALFRGGESHPLVATSSAPLTSPPVPGFVKQLEVAPEIVVVTALESEPELPGANPTGVDDSGNLKAWSLQLATFAEANNAGNLVKKLQAQGYSAYQTKVLSKTGQMLYRVNIGPEVRPDELQQIQRVLKNSMGLEGIVVRFVP